MSELQEAVSDVLAYDISYYRFATPTTDDRYYLTGELILGMVTAGAVTSALAGLTIGFVEGVGKGLGERAISILAELRQTRTHLKAVEAEPLDRVTGQLQGIEQRLDAVSVALREMRQANDERFPDAALASATDEVRQFLGESGFPPPKAEELALRITATVDAKLRTSDSSSRM